MDEFSRHEVLDRLYVALDGYQRYVMDHPVVTDAPEDDAVRQAVVAAGEALVAAYNAAGDAHLG